MLGIGKEKSLPRISAYGKHPAFDDYFSVNMGSQLATALSSWVERGAELGKGRSENTMPRSFRFWMRGIKKDEVVLGIVRDSSDSLGRYYPLLILTSAQMKNRDRLWHRIFSAFSFIFREFENKIAARYDTFKDFEITLSQHIFLQPDLKRREATGLSAWINGWFEKEKHRASMTLPIATLTKTYAGQASEERKPRFFKRKTELPSAVFLGGLTDHPWVAFFNRPLQAQDFFHLFQMPNRNDMDEQNL